MVSAPDPVSARAKLSGWVVTRPSGHETVAVALVSSSRRATEPPVGWVASSSQAACHTPGAAGNVAQGVLDEPRGPAASRSSRPVAVQGVSGVILLERPSVAGHPPIRSAATSGCSAPAMASRTSQAPWARETTSRWPATVVRPVRP